MPVADLVAHEQTRACWCRPDVEVIDGEAIVVHHAADERELAEDGALLYRAVRPRGH